MIDGLLVSREITFLCMKSFCRPLPSMRNLFPLRSETMYRRGQVGRVLVIFVIFSRMKSLRGWMEWWLCGSTLGIGGNRWGRTSGTTNTFKTVMRQKSRRKSTFRQWNVVLPSSKRMTWIGFGDLGWTHGAARIRISSSLTDNIRGKDRTIQGTCQKQTSFDLFVEHRQLT